MLAGLRHSDVATALDDGLGVFDAWGTGLECNDVLRRLLAAPDPTAHPRLADVRLLDETGRDLPLERSPFGIARASGQPVPGTVVGLGSRHGGDTRWVRMAALPRTAPDGSPVVVVTCSDVTAERDAVLALVTAERRLRLTAEHAPIGIALVGIDGALLDVNDALCRLLGYSREELTARTFHDITHPDHLAADVAEVDSLLAGEAETYRLEKVYLTRDGREVWAQLSVALARDEQGEPQYFISMIEDISAQRAATTALDFRAAVSASRMHCSRRRAVSTRTASPAAWPRLSLMSLNSSRSQNSRATWPPCHSARSRAASARSRRAVRLGRPVSWS